MLESSRNTESAHGNCRVFNGASPVSLGASSKRNTESRIHSDLSLCAIKDTLESIGYRL